MFERCTFFFVPTHRRDDASGGARHQELREAILQAGGSLDDSFSDSVTHVVASSMREVAQCASAEALVAAAAAGRAKVIPGAWIDACIQAQRRLPDQHQRFVVPDHRHCFAGVVATFSQVTAEDRRRLRLLVTRHGGVVRSAMTTACTHVITGRLCGAKIQSALRMPGVHIVPPCWVTTSTKKGVREDEARHHPQRATDANAESPDMTVLEGYQHTIFEGEAVLVLSEGAAAIDTKEHILRCGGALAKSKEKSTYIIADTLEAVSDGSADLRAKIEAGGIPVRSSFFVSQSAKFRTRGLTLSSHRAPLLVSKSAIFRTPGMPSKSCMEERN